MHAPDKSSALRLRRIAVGGTGPMGASVAARTAPPSSARSPNMHANGRPVVDDHRPVPDLPTALLERGAGRTAVHEVLGADLGRLLRRALP